MTPTPSAFPPMSNRPKKYKFYVLMSPLNSKILTRTLIRLQGFNLVICFNFPDFWNHCLLSFPFEIIL